MQIPAADPTTSEAKDIAILGIDHPGARDPAYRSRRNELAALARRCRLEGLGIPPLRYTDEENATWRLVVEKLKDAHAAHACRAYTRCREALQIEVRRVPDLRELSERLHRFQGFSIRAIEGLIEPRLFLGSLGNRVMSSTQYVRHASRPEYTPEPDVVHEIIGHVPLFADADFADLSQEIGRAAAVATPGQVVLLDRLYWFTLEFGLVEEGDDVKAYGAGLLSSFGELPHAFTDAVHRRPFRIDDVVSEPYEFSAMQSRLYVVPSFPALHAEVRRLLGSSRYRGA